MADDNGTDRITTRELYALFRSFEKLMDERDRRYTEAAKAAKDSVDASFKASEKAVSKAEAASNAHDRAVNEWRPQLDAQERRFLPKTEYESKVKDIEQQFERDRTEVKALRESIERELRTLRETGNVDAGRRQQTAASQTQSNTVIGWAIAGAGLLIGSGIGIAGLLIGS